MNIKKLRNRINNGNNIFNNLNELCEVLEMDDVPRGGKNIKSFQNKLSQYFNFEKVDGSRKYIFHGETPVHDVIEINNVLTTKERNENKERISLLIAYGLSKQSDNKDGTLIMSRKNLLRRLSMVNDRYTKLRYNYKAEAELINVSESELIRYDNKTGEKLKNDLEAALKLLQKWSLLQWHKIYIIVTEDDETKMHIHKEVNEAEERYITFCDREVFKKMNIKSLDEVFKFGKLDEYKKLIKQIQYEYPMSDFDSNCSSNKLLYYYRGYKITYNFWQLEEYAKENNLELKLHELYDDINIFKQRELVSTSIRRYSKRYNLTFGGAEEFENELKMTKAFIPTKKDNDIINIKVKEDKEHNEEK
jgi:hypothetical protein